MVDVLILLDILAPPTIDTGNFAADWIAFVSGNLNLVVPVVTAVIVIMTALITICALRRKPDSNHKGNWTSISYSFCFFLPHQFR